MSKIWPDPFHDKGDEFWDFDNMVNEYEWEQQHSQQCNQNPVPEKKPQEKLIVKHTGPCLIVLLALFILSIIVPWFWIAFFVCLIAFFS